MCGTFIRAVDQRRLEIVSNIDGEIKTITPKAFKVVPEKLEIPFYGPVRSWISIFFWFQFITACYNQNNTLKQISLGEISDGDPSNDDAMEGSGNFLSLDFSLDEEEVPCTSNDEFDLIEQNYDKLKNSTRYLEVYNEAWEKFES